MSNQLPERCGLKYIKATGPTSPGRCGTPTPEKGKSQRKQECGAWSPPQGQALSLYAG